MTYDPEKYKEKRLKVLGIKKRGIGFGTLALIISVFIIAGLGGVTLPRAVSYMATRHLDDAIFKLESRAGWSKENLDALTRVPGVKSVSETAHDQRLVVTFDRRTTNFSQVTSVFRQHNLTVTLLNRINHRQHQSTMKKEEEELEAS